MKIFKPEVFQGNLSRKKYFEGWYLKHVSADHNHVYSFIPGVSLTKDDSHAFIQIINGISGETWYVTYEISEFSWDKKKFSVKIGNSVFSEDYSEIDIRDEKIIVKGKIIYSNKTKYPSSIVSPGIMGWYSFVPFMECKHAVVSVNHSLKGTLAINDKIIDFNGGKGYIEKDWGVSFPAAWIWLQSNNFENPDVSVMLSVAKIPWLGNYFMGFISFIYLNDTFYRFSTYNNSVISRLEYNDNNVQIEISNKKHKINFNITRKKEGELVAPAHGKMNRMIKESVDSECAVELFDMKLNKLIFEGTGKRAGLEITSNIFELLKNSLR